jgi:cell division protease FtsH
VAHILPDADMVQKISIISRGQAAGYTLTHPTEDKRMQRRAEFKARLAHALGGYITEEMIFGEENLTTGASNDLEQATDLSRRMVTAFGMSEKLGPRTYGKREEMVFLGKELHHERDYSEKTAEIIDSEINVLITEAKKTATEIIKQHRDDLEKIVKLLLAHETIERDEFEKLMGKKNKK